MSYRRSDQGRQDENREVYCSEDVEDARRLGGRKPARTSQGPRNKGERGRYVPVVDVPKWSDCLLDAW